MGSATSLIRYSDSCLSLISFLIGSLVLYSFCRVQTLRKPPGMILLWSCISQTIMDVIWTSDSIAELSGGGIKTYIVFLGWNYNTCLCIEILVRMVRPMGGYAHRAWMYHALSHFISVTISLACLIADSYGIGNYNTCLFREGSNAGYFICRFILLIPLVVHVPLIMFVIFKANRMKSSAGNPKTKVYLTRYSKYLVIYAIFSIFVILYYMVASDVIPDQMVASQIIIGISAFSGLIINCVRLADPAVKKFLKRSLRKISRKVKRRLLRYTFRSATSADNSDEETLVSEYVQDLTNDAIISYLIGLFITLLKATEETELDSENPELFTEKRDETIKSRDFNILDDISLSQRCKIYIVIKYCCDVREYAPKVFSYIRSLEGINNYDIAK